MGILAANQITKPWAQIFIGAILGMGISLPLFKPFFCFYTFQEPSTTFVFTAISALIGLFGNRLDQIKDEIIKKTIYFLIGIVVASTIVMIITLITVDLTRNYCVKDFEQLKTMIEMESEAVINENINIIHEIYSTGAVVSRQDTNEEFLANTYYSSKYIEEDHCSVNHSDYLVTDFSRNQVTITTSSMGNYGLRGEACTKAYSNPPGSDLWVFRKTENEWKIVHFEFNRESE